MKYVLGHQNPDTDSYAAALAYAAFLQATDREATPIALGTPNAETVFVLDRRQIALPSILTELDPGSHIVLVDHNEASQSIAHRDELIIDAVIDHHKIADFVTSYPLTMRCDTVGCTCTILYELFDEQDYTPSPEIAGVMASAIISDTLYFRSPTTTQRDKVALSALAEQAGIEDLEAYALAMFSAKSDLGDMPATEIVTLDYKTFDFHGERMGIGVVETTDPDYLLGRKEELLTAIHTIKAEQDLPQLLFCIVDILEEKNIALVASATEATILAGAFGAETLDHIADLGARVSRKKQLAPALDSYFAS